MPTPVTLFEFVKIRKCLLSMNTVSMNKIIYCSQIEKNLATQLVFIQRHNNQSEVQSRLKHILEFQGKQKAYNVW